jgi:hypothetical protein
LATPKAGWAAAAPFFRFNLPQEVLQKIEGSLAKLEGLKKKELKIRQEDEGTEAEMKQWLKYLFQGGILDPTNDGFWIRGHGPIESRDYGLVTLARNPFSEVADNYLCVMVAGFHLFGTAHALKMLATAHKSFEHHPVGGVIKVDIDIGLEFGDRFDQSSAEWDDENGYSIQELEERLQRMKGKLQPALHHICPKDLDDCLTFLHNL